MEDKLPVSLLEPRFISEIPRSDYMGPKLESNDSKSRQSFISLLRRGPEPGNKSNQPFPKTIKLTCAVWISLNKPIFTPVSLVLHYKENREEFCILLDQISPEGVESMMLSGSTALYPTSDIEFIRLGCVGLSKDFYMYVEDVHVDCKAMQVDIRANDAVANH